MVDTDIKDRIRQAMGVRSAFVDLYRKPLRGQRELNWNEADHPRGQPENAGEFASTPNRSPDADGKPSKPTDSKEFKAWFRDSKIVDGSGEPLVVYHGTSKTFDEFDPSKGSEFGVYTTPNKSYADRYAERFGSGKTLALYLSIKNPLILENKGQISPSDLTKDDVDKLIKQGYDGIVVVRFEDPENLTGPDPIYKASEIVAFHADQVKSANSSAAEFASKQTASTAQVTQPTPAEAQADYQKNGTRSAAFKSWFGDWEHDPANASKVVNEKGEPQETHETIKPVFHGTHADFDQFDNNKKDWSCESGKGFYFTDNIDVANKYARYGSSSKGKVVSAFLRVKNPFDLDSIPSKEQVDSIAKLAVSSAASNPISISHGMTGEEIHQSLCDAIGYHKVNDIIQGAGFDGLTHKARNDMGGRSNQSNADYGRTWIAFEPNQIKSVDNVGTFNPQDDRMAYSIQDRVSRAMRYSAWAAPYTMATSMIDQLAAQAEPPKSKAQQEAGNYRMGHIIVHGLDVTIENPKGSIRSGCSADGKKWSVTMKDHYGYIKRTVSAADGDHIDVFIGSNPEHPIVYIIDQNKKDGSFDEHKCMIGFLSKEDAKAAYMANYSAGWTGFRSIRAMHCRDFKKWINEGDTSGPVVEKYSKVDEKPQRWVTISGNRFPINEDGEIPNPPAWFRKGPSSESKQTKPATYTEKQPVSSSGPQSSSAPKSAAPEPTPAKPKLTFQMKPNDLAKFKQQLRATVENRSSEQSALNHRFALHIAQGATALGKPLPDSLRDELMKNGTSIAEKLGIPVPDVNNASKLASPESVQAIRDHFGNQEVGLGRNAPDPELPQRGRPPEQSEHESLGRMLKTGKNTAGQPLSANAREDITSRMRQLVYGKLGLHPSEMNPNEFNERMRVGIAAYKKTGDSSHDADVADEGHWITLHHGEGHGGVHVRITDNGKILQGPAFLKEKGIENLSDLKKTGSHSSTPEKKPDSRFMTIARDQVKNMNLTTEKAVRDKIQYMEKDLAFARKAAAVDPGRLARLEALHDALAERQEELKPPPVPKPLKEKKIVTPIVTRPDDAKQDSDPEKPDLTRAGREAAWIKAGKTEKQAAGLSKIDWNHLDSDQKKILSEHGKSVIEDERKSLDVTRDKSIVTPSNDPIGQTVRSLEKEESNHELLETDSKPIDGRTGRELDGSAEEKSGIKPSGNIEDTSGGRGSAVVPESPSLVGTAGNAEPDRERDGSAGSPAIRDESASPAGAGRSESDGGLGAGGGGRGHGSVDRAVSESLNEEASPDNPTDCSAGNWRYHNRDFFTGGIKTKFRNNLAAMNLLHELQEEGRFTVTPAEQEVLSKFVGWGAMPGLFNDQWYKGGDQLGISYKDWEDERDKWKSEREEIKSLMTDDEWEAAKHATLNSHFTHPSVVDAHWKMAQRLGFKGGRYLEPSAGIGYYLGMMPADLAGKTRVSAVELDQSTARLLKKLYPAANVESKGFEEHQCPDDFYDLVASNVPFGTYKPHDKRYNKHQAQIHDYFFLKSVDVARPGGLVMHVTSTGTMDKPDDSIRRKLAESCDLVAAFRFPGETHKANAGTEVVTDMVILRKRHPGEKPVSLDETPPEAMAKEPGFTGTTVDSLGRLYHWVNGKRVPGPDWMGTTEVPDPDGGEPIRVNKYFADHPEQILGRLDRSGTMYRGESMNVAKTDDYEQQLQAAIERLPEGVMSASQKAKPNEPEIRAAGDGVKDGGYVVRDGKLFRRESGAEKEEKASPKELERISGMLAIRDARNAVVNAEIDGLNADEPRAELNRLYDAYVAKNGPLSNKENRRAMGTDPDAPNLLALEKWNANTKTATKVDMFNKETIRARKKVDKAESVDEGLSVSLHESGNVDVDRIAELTGKSKDVIESELRKSGLAFDDPQEGWKPADQYLSGNVRKKLVMAKAAAAVDPKYQANVDALEKNQPPDVDPEDIDVKLGAPWIPASDIQQFASEMSGMRPGNFTVSHVEQTGDWHFRFTPENRWNKSGSAAMSELGTSRRPFADILQHILDGKSLAVYDPNRDGTRDLNEDETRAAEEKAALIKEKFSEWIWSDEERRNRLGRYYNDNFNNVVPMKYNGGHQLFPGMRPDFEPRDIQKNFVWQVVTTGRGLAAHEVGTGKTASMIAAAMELRRLGLAKKPCLAVLKANIEQITKEALELYPGAKILSTNEKFDAKNRKRTIAEIATGDYDLVIMTHDNIDMLAMKPATVQKYIRDELAELEAAKTAAWHEDPDKNNRIVKSLEDAKSKLEAKLKESLDQESKDDAVSFEETGIDQLFVDEAHKYKSLPVYTKGERVKGVPQSRSERATNMLMRTRWLMEKNGGRGVVFATGTPVANTMAELYNIQRYLQPDELKERGLSSFDAWSSAFGDKVTKYEATATGDYAPVTRFAKFVNIPELMQIASQVMDVQRADFLKKKDGTPAVVRPKRHDKIVTSELSDGTTRMMNDLKQRASAIKARGGKPEKGADNMAVVCSDGRKGSVDLRLLYKDAKDDPNSKANQCVRKILEIHKARPEVSQLIFSNVGVNPSPDTGFHLYGDVIDKLVQGGIPREKIADFSVLEGAKKDAAQEAMRRGDVIVGIGSTEKLGTGVNVQNRVAAMHHLDVPWQPAEIEQRDGRGYRCGNKNDPTKPANEQNVDIYRYVSEGSLDTFMWQVVGNKAHFINQIVNGQDKKTRSVSDEDTETLSPEQLMAVASGDTRVLKKVQLEADLRELRMGADRHKRDQAKLGDKLKGREKGLVETAAQVERMKKDAEHLKSTAEADFSMSIGGQPFAKRSEAIEALDNRYHDESNINYWNRDGKPIAEYRGFKISLPTNHSSPVLILTSPHGEQYESRTSMASIDAVLRGIPKKYEDIKRDHEIAIKDIEQIKSSVGGAYRRSAEFEEKKKLLALLEQELSDKEDPVSSSENENLKKKVNEVETYARLALPSVVDRYQRFSEKRRSNFRRLIRESVDRYSRGGSQMDQSTVVANTVVSPVCARQERTISERIERAKAYYSMRYGSWEESKHPRGQPENPGQFTSGGGAAAKQESPSSQSPTGAAASPAKPPEQKPAGPVPMAQANPSGAANPAKPAQSGSPAQSAPAGNVSQAIKDLGPLNQPATPPPPGKMYAPDPAQGKAARVGVPGAFVPPPPAMDQFKLPNLTPEERAEESKFAQMFEANPDGMADKMIDAASRMELGNDGPNFFGTDDAKNLLPDWRGTSVVGPDGKKSLSPETRDYRARYNTSLHQTANAIAKRAFLKYLDTTVANLPPEKKTVLVTAGGVAAGKGYAISQIPSVKQILENAGAVWDTAGEQNSTELPWVHAECKKRGIKVFAAYIHADPSVTWENDKGGVISRATAKGRMVDARAYADSYGHGAKNFSAWHQTVQNDPDVQVAFIDNQRGKPAEFLPSMPQSALSVDTDSLYKNCLEVLSNYQTFPAAKEGGSGGVRIWGPPKATPAQIPQNPQPNNAQV